MADDRKFNAAVKFLKENPTAVVSIERDYYTGARGGTVTTWGVRVTDGEGTQRNVDTHTRREAQIIKAKILDAVLDIDEIDENPMEALRRNIARGVYSI